MSIKRFSCIVLSAFYAALYERAKEMEESPQRWFLNNHGKDGAWDGLCANGQKQSPILLNINNAEKAQLPRLIGMNYFRKFKYFKITNTGYSVHINVPFGLGILMSGGPLKGYYTLEDVHWHWNKTEHSIEPEKFLMLEMHLVHRNAKYKTFEEASGQEDGLAIIAVLYRLSNEPNQHLHNILKQISAVQEPGQGTYLEEPICIKELLPEDTTVYFTYQGSLCQPPCNESVTWIIYRQPSTVSEDQIKMFQSIKAEDGRKLLSNCRRLQPTNNRPIIVQTLE